MSDNDLHNPVHGHSNGNGVADTADALLDRLTVSLRNTNVPDGPDEATLASTIAALRSSPISLKRKFTMKPALKFAIAACLVLAAGILFFVVPLTRDNVAFANILEQVNQSRSVRFNATIKMTMPDKKEQTVEAKMALLGNRLRQELPGMVSIMDFGKGEALTLIVKEKIAMRIKVENLPPEVKRANLFEEFRQMKPGDAKDIGEKEFDGRKLHGFLVEKSGASTTVWADPKTKEPVRVEASFEMPSIAKSTTVFKDFQWDAPVEVAEVEPDVTGYQVREMTMDASPPTEKDLLTGLRTIATLNHGEFPASFDMAGVGEAMKKYATDASPKDQKEFQNKLFPDVMKIARGIGFITTETGEDWHYAAKGAKIDEKDRPILWYKPKGSQTYRVIYADLTAKDAAADALPKVESTKLTPGPSPFTMPPQKK
jgi:hypothetical protein